MAMRVKSTVATASLAVAMLAALVAPEAGAADLAYGGRVVDAKGAPLAGPVDITLRFFGSERGSDQLGTSRTFAAVALADGVFQLTLALDDAEQAAIFGDGDRTVFVEVEADGKVYPRQSFAAVPLALRVPVDNDTLIFSLDSKLTVGNVSMEKVTGLAEALAAVSPHSVATSQQAGLVVKPYGSSADQTGELRFEERAGDNYIGFKAPDAVAADTIWSLPAADGSAGQVLSTNGAGALAWTTPAGSGDMLASANLSDVADAAAARANLGLGALATSSAVGSAEIADGAIADVDVSASAAIADTKLATITTAGKVSGAAITSGTISGMAAFAGSGGVQTSGAITGTGNFNVSGTGAATTELRFGDNDNSNYVGLRAPATVSANKVWTLPAVDGGAGQFLTTDGAGILSWGSPAGGGDLMASANLADLSNAGTARTNLGLGPLATLSAVGSTEITDGAIANADVSPTAAIATSKLSGPITSIAGHGLGGLATLGSIGSAEITDGTIADADVSDAAAIATSKLAGAVTAIAGHGLGSLASLSAVGSSEITDGTIADADISGTAALATSKLSGPLTAVNGHGLGALATANSIGSAEISDGSLTDADLSPSAAIADTKLATIATVGKVANSATTATSANTASAIVARDASGNFSAGTITATLSGNATNVTGTVAVANGGTGATSAAAARASLGAAAAGANSDITSLTGLTTALPVAQGGTGSGSAPANGQLLIGNGTGYALANLTPGTGISIANAAGSVTINATDDASTKVAKSGDTMTGTLNLAANGLTVGTTQLVITGGNVGIGTSSPQVPVDIAGVMLRVARSSSDPVTCNATYDGALAVTSKYTTCICKNGTGWVSTTDGSTACVWSGTASLEISVTSGNASAMNVTGTTQGVQATGSNVTFTVTNNGTATSASLSFSLSNTTNFSFTGGTCVNGSTQLAPGGTCTIIVQPRATANGSLSGNLNVTANNNPSYALSGTASGFGPSCDSATEVSYNGSCYYLDGSNGCLAGYSLAPQSVLSTIAASFVGKTYKTAISDNCCIRHLDQASQGQDWGFATGVCNAAGPFASAPTLNGSNCTDSQNSSAQQLTLCKSN
jgi:hypothetical protein